MRDPACVTLRNETEWVETDDAGWNRLAGTAPDAIRAAVVVAATGRGISEYGTGIAAAGIVHALIGKLRQP